MTELLTLFPKVKGFGQTPAKKINRISFFCCKFFPHIEFPCSVTRGMCSSEQQLDSDGFELCLDLLWKAGAVLGEQGLDLSWRPCSPRSTNLTASVTKL